jgi:gamma-glutamyltranspeptidase/glutathione hydrolase
MTLAPTHPVRLPSAMVSTVDALATEAGVATLRRGGSAVDAAIAANAVLSVTLPNQCGLGGDLFAIVQPQGGSPEVLMAAGRAGSGADPARLRAEGHQQMRADADPRSATIPGCVDGWAALHARFGRLEFAELLRPAEDYASHGFPVSPYLAGPLSRRSAAAAYLDTPGELAALRAGDLIRRPGAARVLGELARSGRDGFYQGEFGAALVDLGAGEFTEADLRADQAEWVTPLSADVWGARVWTPPPPSQGYVTLSAAWMAERVGVAADADDPAWAHLLIEAMRQAAYDRPEVLFDGADGIGLLSPARLSPRADAIRADRIADLSDAYRSAGTTYLCAVDASGMAVSLIQSNCMSFGSGLLVGDTGIWLHNRGIGFNLIDGHPAEYRPGHRPPHTLAPVLITSSSGDFQAALGTRGGDSQPQIVLQLLARLLVSGQDPASALAAGRWILRGAGDDTSFDTWGFGGQVRVSLEGQAPRSWPDALRRIGHDVHEEPSFAHPFGHAQIIQRSPGGLIGGADPRTGTAAVGGY